VGDYGFVRPAAGAGRSVAGHRLQSQRRPAPPRQRSTLGQSAFNAAGGVYKHAVQSMAFIFLTPFFFGKRNVMVIPSGEVHLLDGTGYSHSHRFWFVCVAERI
jgi:hypothetical protein